MGYDVAKLVRSDVDDELICKVCYGVLDQPRVMCAACRRTSRKIGPAVLKRSVKGARKARAVEVGQFLPT